MIVYLNHNFSPQILLGAPIANTDVKVRVQAQFRRCRKDMGIGWSQSESMILMLYFGFNGLRNDVCRCSGHLLMLGMIVIVLLPIQNLSPSAGDAVRPYI